MVRCCSSLAEHICMGIGGSPNLGTVQSTLYNNGTLVPKEKAVAYSRRPVGIQSPSDEKADSVVCTRPCMMMLHSATIR